MVGTKGSRAQVLVSLCVNVILASVIVCIYVGKILIGPDGSSA
jgi:hypothetical protein